MHSSAFTLLLLTALALPAQDVHVRVQPGAPPSSPGGPDTSPTPEVQTTFPTIQNALDHHPFAGPAPGKDGRPARVIIEIAPGTYHERIIVTQNHPDITLLGTGAKPEDTVITNALNAKTAGGTFFTETAEINGDGFEADNLTFENTAGVGNPGAGQAVAAAVRADRVVFKHVRFLGHQDTLFADFGRQYYLDCFLTGGVDYIFGNAAAVFDHSELNSNSPGFITAQSRTDPRQPTGYVILKSRITSSLDQTAPDQTAPGQTAPGQTAPDHTAPTMDPSLPGAGSTASARNRIGLGRPWRPYARVVYIDDSLPAELSPAGWNNWGKPSNESTAWYAEYGSTGPGAVPSSSSTPRVPWAHTLSSKDLAQFLPANFLRGTDNWNPEAAAARLP